jgi:cytokinin dehydrogenase
MNHATRRAFLAATGASVAMVAGEFLCAREVSAEEQTRFRDSLAGRLASQLPSFDGVFVFDQLVCRAMATDYGHFVHRMPLGVLFPKTVADVQRGIRFANAQGLKIGMRGTGGAAYGQSQVASGIVISSSSLRAIRWASADLIDAEPGALWKEVCEATVARNMTPPVLPDNLFISVGGTLNTGGLGETSYRLGAQVDHVVELDVVTGAGELITCSSARHDDLFQMVLAGMGQCGIIVRARLKLQSAPASVIVRRFEYQGRGTFLADLAQLAKDEAAGAIAGDLNRDGATWTPVITMTSFTSGTPPWIGRVQGRLIGSEVTQSYDDYLNRNTEEHLKAVASGAKFVPHVYMHFFLPQDGALPMANYLADTPDAALGASGIAVFPMIRENFTRPLQRMPAGALSYHMRIYRVAAREGAPEHLQMLALNVRECLPRIFASGGTVYLPFSPLLDSSQLLQQFGQTIWERFRAAKSKYDPREVLTPGAGLFKT